MARVGRLAVVSQEPKGFQDPGTQCIASKSILFTQILELIDGDSRSLNVAKLDLALEEHHCRNELPIDETILSAQPGLLNSESPLVRICSDSSSISGMGFSNLFFSDIGSSLTLAASCKSRELHDSTRLKTSQTHFIQSPMLY